MFRLEAKARCGTSDFRAGFLAKNPISSLFSVDPKFNPRKKKNSLISELNYKY